MGIRGSRGDKVNNNILLFSSKTLSQFILSPLSYILSFMTLGLISKWQVVNMKI
jgi:hypothetical protein